MSERAELILVTLACLPVLTVLVVLIGTVLS